MIEKKYTNEAVIRNYFRAEGHERTIYRKGYSVFYTDDTLYSYGYHFTLAQKCKNGYILNGDRYSSTTSHHQSLTRQNVPIGTEYAIIPYQCLTEMFSSMDKVISGQLVSEIEIIDTCDDTYEDAYYMKEGVKVHYKIHHLGSSVIRYKRRYYLSSIDEDGNYYLVRLPHKVEAVSEGYRSLAETLTDEQYALYQQGDILRQGEYFLEPTEYTTKELETFTKLLPKWYDLSKGVGNPHKARDARKGDFYIYIRGTLRHPQHRMIRLGDVWHRVYKNTAVESWSADGNVD